ncbi:hypothetical protein KUTeg_007902 [Tegillarca granosa]|uniref:Guided entry of tail-anchored proteins factor 1 n=1 Tax=Tegillarca granosa TaxID=220873 RepID=A0ABQ9FGT9_TEGGR|nr:hypothetical protein KUTeg_007902 [Tegillarca granosa]
MYNPGFHHIQNYPMVCLYLNLYQITDEELNLRSEVKDLKAAQDTISMTDEFAKYAKFQRRIDKLLVTIKEHSSFRAKHTAMLTFGVKIGIHVMHVV